MNIGDGVPRILVVDDERGIREGCRKILTAEGYEVETAEDGMAGLKLFKERGDFAAALIDLKMPGMGGMEVVEAIKRQQPATAVIIMTAYSTVPSVVQGIKLGATDYIPKPFTPDEISTAVRKALQQTGQQGYRAQTEGVGALFNKEAIIAVLNRAADDEAFAMKFADPGSVTLEEYGLTPEERAALLSVMQPAAQEALRAVSQELKGPLESIASLARTMQEPDVTGEQKKKFFTRIVTRAERALDKIEEYLTLSRISTGELDIDPKRVKFYKEIIQKVLDDHYEMMAEQGMSITVDIPEDLEVVCDPQYIRIVYNNLLRNAIQYGTAVTKIYLGYSGLQYGYHYFNVANVGEWIKEDESKRIFEKYETVGKRGIGIGLFAAKEIIRKHGGDIWVEPCYFLEGKFLAEKAVMKGTNELFLTGNNFILRLHRVVL